ncbi:hypothetical protein C8Q69DRAFT_267760 [Paecilomyces variotii]|uniref:Uncharacterized protein n=1 Tax=Byssochlamys spectabilis TaxID=264951 RepID=A0A443HVM8_BYSSP|nr:hypothetical protein C8Q69DRAFT_267760 [Paecilomyces variotii]RWQ95810.1 hypothetical protein C8Q69DRAFT_267760 [Paecilomyces variotii]
MSIDCSSLALYLPSPRSFHQSLGLLFISLFHFLPRGFIPGGLFFLSGPISVESLGASGGNLFIFNLRLFLSGWSIFLEGFLGIYFHRHSNAKPQCGCHRYTFNRASISRISEGDLDKR